MATDYRKRLTEVEVSLMLSHVKQILTRHVASVTPPEGISLGDCLYALALHSVPEHVATAWRALTHWRQADDTEPSALTTQAAYGIPTQFPSGRVFLLQYTRHYALQNGHVILNIGDRTPETVHAHEILGGNVATELEEWCVHTCQITKRVVRSCDTACDVLQLVSTVGQLHRICPEMVRYTFDTTQEALQAQERRSPVPVGWEKIDRVLLREMLEHLALCYLLPTSQHSDFTHITQNWNWAFDKRTVNLACWPAQMSVSKDRLSICDP